jgi:hypothetical protein
MAKMVLVEDHSRRSPAEITRMMRGFSYFKEDREVLNKEVKII